MVAKDTQLKDRVVAIIKDKTVIYLDEKGVGYKGFEVPESAATLILSLIEEELLKHKVILNEFNHGEFMDMVEAVPISVIYNVLRGKK